jgi:CheY-like chemotaxis protein
VPFTGLRVLVAEDNPVNVKVVGKMLRKLGCDFDVAEHGTAALVRCRATSYDLVLMDCQMPELDGLAATRRIRTEERLRGIAGEARLPIVALTANAMPGDREACLAAGMDDYLSKPVDLGALRAMIARWALRRDADAPADAAEQAS